MVSAVGLSFFVFVAAAQTVPEKRLIAFGWEFGGTSLANLAAHADRFDSMPFDGIGFHLAARLSDGTRIKSRTIMHDPPWTRGAFARQIASYRALTSRKALRCSFVGSFRAPTNRIDWTDDAAWIRIATNVAVSAWVAKEGGFAGLSVDPEDYQHVRQFTQGPGDPPYDRLCEIVRRRGAEVFGAAFREYPEMTLFCFWGLSWLHDWLLKADDPLAAACEEGNLWAAFLNGVLDVMPTSVRFVDANENSYRFSAEKNDYIADAWRKRSELLAYVAPENRERYLHCLRSGSALYLDMYCNPPESAWYKEPVGGLRLERLRQDFGQAWRASEGFVWLWGERGSWIDWRQKDWVGAMTNWESRLPGVTFMLRAMKDPVGMFDRRTAELAASGMLSNLVENASCDSRDASVPKPYGTWHSSKDGSGCFLADPCGGKDGGGCLVAEGVGHGCFSVNAVGVRPGEWYGVAVACKGDSALVNVAWRGKNGKYVGSSQNPISRPPAGADGWSHPRTVVCVPPGANVLNLTFGVRNQGEGVRTCFDDVAIFRLSPAPFVK